MAHGVASSMRRVLRDDAALVWYDTRYPNPGNRHLKTMTKGRIRRLFPGMQLQLESTTVLPPLARLLGRSTGSVYPVLAALPPLRSHYIGLLRPARD